MCNTFRLYLQSISINMPASFAGTRKCNEFPSKVHHRLYESQNQGQALLVDSVLLPRMSYPEANTESLRKPCLFLNFSTPNSSDRQPFTEDSGSILETPDKSF